jgi:hypothetical protein
VFALEVVKEIAVVPVSIVEKFVESCKIAVLTCVLISKAERPPANVENPRAQRPNPVP